MARVTKITGRVFEKDSEKFVLYQDFEMRKIIGAKLEELNAEELGEVFEKMVEDRKEPNEPKDEDNN